MTKLVTHASPLQSLPRNHLMDEEIKVQKESRLSQTATPAPVPGRAAISLPATGSCPRRLSVAQAESAVLCGIRKQTHYLLSPSLQGETMLRASKGSVEPLGEADPSQDVGAAVGELEPSFQGSLETSLDLGWH